MANQASLKEITDHLTIPSLKREFNGQYTSNQNTLHILQWNTLAQGLSNPKQNFVRVVPETVNYDTRKWRLLEQILIRKPNLCALEEVDTYNDFLQYQLPNYGYTCFYTPKTQSPCFAFQEDSVNFKGPDGILMCYRSEMFDEVTRYSCVQPLENEQGKQFFALLELKHKSSSVHIIFIATHFKAKKAFANIRQKQAQAIMQYISKHYSSNKHIILTGDFNGEPNEPFYDVIRQAGFSSAYRTILDDKEPSFTTWKFRERDGVEEEQCRCIDYVFYRPEGFKPNIILKLPTKEEIGVNGLPSNEYPSDHLALETVFQINP